TGLGVPQAHAAVERGAGQALAVPTEGDCPDLRGVAAEDVLLPLRLDVPDPHRLIVTAAGDAPAVGAEGHAGAARVAGEAGQYLPRRQVPNFNRVVVAGGGRAPAVGAESDVPDAVRVGRERLLPRVPGGVPEADRLIVAGRGQEPAVRAEG